MLNESVVIGIVLLIAFSAVSLYLYSRLAYLEKKVGMMESLVVDMRMAIDALMSEDMMNPASVPISGPAAAAAAAAAASAEPVPGGLEAEAVDSSADEAFYSNVLERAADAAAEPPSGEAGIEEVMAGFDKPIDEGAPLDQAAEAAPELTAVASSSTMRPNYDTMTKAELAAAAEERGLRVRKNMSRNEILSLLRRAEPQEIGTQSTGAGDVSGSAGTLFTAGATLDGDFPVDLGQAGVATDADASA